MKQIDADARDKAGLVTEVRTGTRQRPTIPAASIVSLSIAGLFAGIGGFEEGFRRQGHRASLLCEFEPGARRVLTAQFPESKLVGDVRELAALTDCDVITAGFPCQDLSPVGETKGIGGTKSGVVSEVFRLLATVDSRTKWLILENVPFMLRLEKGRAMSVITSTLTDLGWQWAYRTIDTQAFGLPQRRRRIFLLASRTLDPRPVLLGQDVGEAAPSNRKNFAKGFYWTEGHRGLGWAIDSIPPLKGGSGVSIPSPPAIWFPSTGKIVVPTIETAEKLQGFPAGWTSAASAEPGGDRCRWRLVGNAVSVPVSSWLAGRLGMESEYDGSRDSKLGKDVPWPASAWCVDGELARSDVSTWPLKVPTRHLASFVGTDVRPLSLRATSGFLSRLEHSGLKRDEAFDSDLRRQVIAARTAERSDVLAQDVDPAVSRRMANTRGRDNLAERTLRSTLYKKGFRFRIHYKAIEGVRRTVDIAFPSSRLAIFIDGCFWHGCPIHGTWPKKNATFWRKKIEANRKRDRDTDGKLKVNGWAVIRIWEHEDPEVASRRIVHTLNARASKPKRQ